MTFYQEQGVNFCEVRVEPVFFMFDAKLWTRLTRLLLIYSLLRGRHLISTNSKTAHAGSRIMKAMLLGASA